MLALCNIAVSIHVKYKTQVKLFSAQCVMIFCNYI